MNFKIILFVTFGFLLLIACNPKEAGKEKPNILFICVDDLRPELGCYGCDYINSPNLDRLAEEGFLFTRHFVNIPTCGASRNCLLTGQLPVSAAHLNNNIMARTISVQQESEVPETFIHQLKRNGYYTVGIGKISHYPDGYVYEYLDPVSNQLELPHSWNEMLLDDKKWGSGHNAFFGYSNGTNRNSLNKEVKPYEMADVPDTAFADGLTTNLAIQKIRELKERNQPFFLGVGFFKPHLPFASPKKYWDMYIEGELPLSPVPFIPENVNTASLHPSNEFNQYKLGEEKASLEAPVSDAYARKVRHAYFACVSFVDAQIGMLMEELEKQGLSENTIVVVWGDHGWHLGDDLVWGKHTVFERALKSAFIMKVPGMKNGQRIDKIVSTTDIYPTLMELCRTPVKHSLDGSSLTGIMKNSNDENWRNTAYSYFRNGISLRTDRYRLTRYFRNQEPLIELYDHELDPDETINIATEQPEIVNSLLPILEKGNTGLYSQN